MHALPGQVYIHPKSITPADTEQTDGPSTLLSLRETREKETVYCFLPSLREKRKTRLHGTVRIFIEI